VGPTNQTTRPHAVSMTSENVDETSNRKKKKRKERRFV